GSLGVTLTYTIDQVNPFWFARVDENRGAGDPALHGNNQCVPKSPASYEPGFNTQTYFALYYQQDDGHGGHIDTPLASYTGNTGDGRDVNGFHQTDMHWVSPGADKQGYDYPIADTPGVSEVPTNEGNSSFEIDLTSDVPNIVTDPATGVRTLYLDVTTLSGALENVFEIWAGPPDYADTMPSDVNARNLAIVNDPGAHHADGVQVEAIGVLPINNLYGNAIDWPIADFSPTAAGGTVSISIFDMDSGAQPPITFFFDSIPESAWSLTFSDPGVDDPDGVPAGTRCEIGSCNDQWVSPSYQITIPGDLSNCDPLNPTQADCTPFVGGRLMARVHGGEFDTHVWQVTADLPTATDPTQSCTAFPIAVHEGTRSVTPPGQGASPYPDAADFDYPSPPPAYTDFYDHTPDVPLLSAAAGDLFYLQQGFGSGNFGWLLWNEGKPGNEGTLADSLTWPGDSFDYADHGDTQIYPAAHGIPYIVRGYVEPGDSMDLMLHQQDWVAANTGSVNSAAVRDALETLVDDAPVLRLIVWDQGAEQGSNGRYRIQRFGLFRLIGFHLSQSGQGGSWVLLEFMGFDDSCGQLQTTEDIDLTIGNLQVIDQGTLHQEQPFSVQATISNTGTVDVNSQFFVDLYLNPTQTDPLLIDESVGYTAVPALAAGTQQTVTITTTAGTTRLLNNALYAMVDSLNQTGETDETNNVVQIEFDVLPKEEWLIYLPLVKRP
ncbi:MAG: hypothetical protein KC419_11770, partial [Anaerolineales bacterium]|nr:hypothetical protein [Anaerolineales bacterium]